MKIIRKSVLSCLVCLTSAISYSQTPTITLSDDGEIKRHQENGEVIKVNLNSDTFVASLNPVNWTFTNLPEGVSVGNINRISDTEVDLVLSGNATSNYSKSITDFTVTISNEELTTLSTGSVSASTGVLFDASYWKLAWSDEFDVDGAPNSDNWTHEIWNPGQFNHELQYYTNSLENSRIEDGNLLIQAIKKGTNWYSARLQARNKVDFLYGTIEARLKVPPGKGTWPAFWLMPTESVYGDWPHSGEYDIMEYVGFQPNRVYSTTHTGAHYGANGIGSSYDNQTVEEEFHVYKMIWTPDSMVTYFDGIEFFKYVNPWDGNTEVWPYNQKFYPILNLAIGGDWGGAQGVDPNLDTCNYYIDYVRVYKNITDMIITGPGEVYADQKDISFSIEKIDGVTYTWLPSGNYSIRTDPDSNEVTINWGCNTDTVKVDLLVDGTEWYTITKVVKVKPFEIIGDEWVDEQATGELYTTQNIDGAIYEWTASSGITIVSGQGSDSIYVDFAQEGDIYLFINSDDCGYKYDTFSVRFGDGQFPYPEGSAAAPIPGTIKIAYYDLGGEGVAYHDIDGINQGGILRPDDGVDLESNDGGTTIGYTKTGEWMEYTVDVAESAPYDLKIRAGGQNSGKLKFSQNGNIVAESVSIPASGSWTAFKDVLVPAINLEQGTSILKVEFAQGGCNLGNLTFVEPSGIENIEIGDNIEIYPNPTSNILNFSINDGIENGNEISVKIFNLDGELILSNLLAFDEDKTLRIDVSMLPKGIYFLNLNSESRNINAKFFKQ
jgi:beta-glucanase (GH16 family)